MKPTSVLINVARGGIIDEEALYETLKNNQILGAAIDVFSQEPLEENSKLRTLNNIVLTPHIGASTEEAQERVGLMAIEQIKSFFIENKTLNEVKK